MACSFIQLTNSEGEIIAVNTRAIAYVREQKDEYPAIIYFTDEDFEAVREDFETIIQRITLAGGKVV